MKRPVLLLNSLLQNTETLSASSFI